VNGVRYGIGSTRHVERSFINALAVLGQIRRQAAVLVQTFDHGLPRLATVPPAMEEDNCGRPDRTGFAHVQPHEGRSYASVNMTG
jgi:hypothetical protein